jgi:hypothetical protein
MEVGTLQKVVKYSLDQKLRELRVGRYLYNPQVATFLLIDFQNLIIIKAKALTSYGRKMLT